MAELTEDEIEYIRMMSGDDCEDYDVTDERMQKLHDRGLAMQPCGCAAPEDVTVVLVLRVRVAKAAKLFNENVEGGSGSVAQKYTHLKELLDEWESRCGLAGGAVTIGRMNLGIDTPDDGDEFSRGWL
jgi:hypothetical protein